MFDKIITQPIIPIIVIENAENAEPLADALLEGGSKIIEITFRTNAAAEAIRRIIKICPEITVGAGTVLTTDQAERAIDLGVKFALAPGLNPDVINVFKKHNVLFIPGIMTPSDIEKGLSMECKLLKFFPAEAAGGVKMLKSLAGPYASAGVKFCPTGGIDLNNMNDYLSLPIVSSIGGTWIAGKEQIANKEWRAISAQMKNALAKAEEIKK